jgi:hypothetical protein
MPQLFEKRANSIALAILYPEGSGGFLPVPVPFALALSDVTIGRFAR